MRSLVTVLVSAVLFSFAPVRAEAAVPAPLKHEHTFHARSHHPHFGHGSFHWVRRAIVHIFVGHVHEAFTVSRCESGFSVDAVNGQYLGLFQMGSSERASFGNGQHAWGQTAAAHRYFKVAGWSPWSCPAY